MSAWVALVSLVAASGASSSGGVQGALTLPAPGLEGGSVVRVEPSGELEVLDDRVGHVRWSTHLGAPARQVAVDGRRVYVATGRHLRAFAGGIARWALELGAPAEGLAVVAPDRLLVALPAGRLFVDAAAGRFCTPRDPCDDLPTWRVGQIGVPFLDLPRFGVPGLGLAISPALLDQGDVLGALVPPGAGLRVPAAPPAPVAPSVRAMGAGPTIEVERGRSGKVRGLALGAAPRVGGPEDARTDAGASTAP